MGQDVGRPVGEDEVGIRDRIMGWLDRGEPPELDPDAVVEVAHVMLHDGPMLVAALERAGIPARGIEAFDIASRSTTRMRILVHARHAARAAAVLEDVEGRYKRPIL